MKKLAMLLGCGMVAFAIGCGGEPKPTTPPVDPKTMMDQMKTEQEKASAANADKKEGEAAPETKEGDAAAPEKKEGEAAAPEKKEGEAAPEKKEGEAAPEKKEEKKE